MSNESRPGFYRDKNGQWRPDRRKTTDRRTAGSKIEHDRRTYFRRKADRELFETDHRAMIEEALEDFAEEHGGRL